MTIRARLETTLKDANNSIVAFYSAFWPDNGQPCERSWSKQRLDGLVLIINTKIFALAAPLPQESKSHQNLVLALVAIRHPPLGSGHSSGATKVHMQESPSPASLQRCWHRP